MALRGIAGTAAVLGYSFVVSIVLGLAIKAVMGFRVSSDVEEAGVDIAIHAETAYHSGSSSVSGFHPLGQKPIGHPLSHAELGEELGESPRRELAEARAAATVSS